MDRRDDGATVAVATAEDAAGAVARAALLLGSPLPVTNRAVVLLPEPPAPALVRGVARVLVAPSAVVARPGVIVAAVSRWTVVPVGPGGRRFDEVRVRASLLDRPRLLICQLPTGGMSSTPIPLLASFADPRQRLAVRFGGDAGAAAELAAPLRPDLVALTGRLDGKVVVVLSADLVAAELVARAWKPAGDDALVPWQHPIVQRAIDLDLGVTTPASLLLMAGDADAANIAEGISPRLGLRGAVGRAHGPG